ncbi:MAG: hypothetical protein JW944_07955 [Deltaproteobacteria bacterium]|nr:hypothetical protein [Deltaproteobacteria bacterium]
MKKSRLKATGAMIIVPSLFHIAMGSMTEVDNLFHANVYLPFNLRKRGLFFEIR